MTIIMMLITKMILNVIQVLGNLFVRVMAPVSRACVSVTMTTLPREGTMASIASAMIGHVQRSMSGQLRRI